MIKRESKFGSYFRHWIMANPVYECCAFELKQTTKQALAFSAVKEHQIDGLFTAKHGKKGILYKAPDDSRGVKPFDYFYLKNSGAYVGIRYPGFFCLIDIDDFIDEMQTTKRASLTAERAKKIAVQVVTQIK